MPTRNPAEIQEDEYAFPYHYVARYGTHGFGQTFHDSWGISYASTIEFLLERIAAARVSEIVDVGCGDGRFTRELALRGAKRVVGVDRSPRAIALARAMNHDLPALRFLEADITAAWSEPPFEAAVLMEVLEHIPIDDAPALVRAVRKLLRPGGRLFLTVPHRNTPLQAKHFRHFSVQTLSDALRSDFELCAVVPFERMGWRRSLLDTLLGNRIFLLNHAGALNTLYRWYKRRLFHCRGEAECRRIFVEAVAR
ncbi:MAG: hypothetical protein A3G83_00470 [Betaproteobacteria bacterium RIFCSPLOWO2_12_FULL_68_20]|nr:MAG: hypothetical protein A3G83_00470 [Betaproteobacteria bacterium RIFCSPLOWO2_12_FULL_68_20]